MSCIRNPINYFREGIVMGNSKEEIFARRVGERMKLLGIDQAGLAKMLGISYQAVQHYLKGRRFPRGERMGDLARALCCKIDYLYGLTDNANFHEGELNDIPPNSPERAAFIFRQVAHSLGIKMGRPCFPLEWEDYRDGKITDFEFYRAVRKHIQELIDSIMSRHVDAI